MPNTYTEIHIQIVFAVQNRISLIKETWKDELYKYITGIVQNHGHKMLQINGMPDHIHIFIGLRPTQSISNLVQLIKQGSSKWINMNVLIKENFSWQSGFGAFSYAKSDISNVIHYIENQEKHHQKITFREEYRKLLEEFEVDYDERFIFKDIDS